LILLNDFFELPMESSTTLRDGVITAIQPQKRLKSRLNIFLDGDFAFGLDAEVVLRHRLKKGMAFSIEEQQRLLFEEDLKTALNRVFRWLGQRSYSEQEIRRKLATAKYHEMIIDRALARCRELGYLDDLRFARDFIKAQLSRRVQGRLRLRPVLLRKGIPAKIADEVLAEYFDNLDPATLATQVAEKFLKRRGRTIPAEKLGKRLADHLLRAGFSWEQIQDAIRRQKLKEVEDL